MSLLNQLSNAWHAFKDTNPPPIIDRTTVYSEPSAPMLVGGNEKSQMTAIINRIALDVASIDFKHVYTDENHRYTKDADSTLNDCLTLSANIDQTARSFMIDLVITMLDQGHAVIVPTCTKTDPEKYDGFKVLEMRVGTVTQWYNNRVTVKVYNQYTGQKQEITMKKESVCIIQNPMYIIMNERNSLLQRLVRKLALMDKIDAMQGSGKLDVIIQLPYTIKSDRRKNQSEIRRKAIEEQLNSSKYGIAYIDGTEKITQLNRSVENTLPAQIDSLTAQLYSQLNMTESIMNGTATEEQMTNYLTRTVEPIASAIAEEIKRKFLTPTARTQHQDIQFFRNPFKLVPVSKLADLVDKFTRNEVMTSNEFRQIVGLKPSDNPDADALRNKNLNKSDAEIQNENLMAPTIDSQLPQDQEENPYQGLVDNYMKEEQNET